MLIQSMMVSIYVLSLWAEESKSAFKNSNTGPTYFLNADLDSWAHKDKYVWYHGCSEYFVWIFIKWTVQYRTNALG